MFLHHDLCKWIVLQKVCLLFVGRHQFYFLWIFILIGSNAHYKQQFDVNSIFLMPNRYYQFANYSAGHSFTHTLLISQLEIYLLVLSITRLDVMFHPPTLRCLIQFDNYGLMTFALGSSRAILAFHWSALTDFVSFRQLIRLGDPIINCHLETLYTSFSRYSRISL